MNKYQKTSKNDQYDKLKTVAIYGALTIATLSVVTIAGVKIIRNLRKNNASADALDEGSATSVANEIKFAFENNGYWFGTSWGTDTESLIRIFRDEIKSKEHYEQVQKKYKILYGNALNIDLVDELYDNPGVYQQLLTIISSKPSK